MLISKHKQNPQKALTKVIMITLFLCLTAQNPCYVVVCEYEEIIISVEQKQENYRWIITKQFIF